MIFLFTDFGHTGPYVGQVHAVLKRELPAVPVIDLMHDAPAFDAQSAAYLLPAVAAQARPGDVVMAVVDPGVGGARACAALNADGVWYVGPDNGLLSQVQRRATRSDAFVLPVSAQASATFHGRDVFAPAAVHLLTQGRCEASAPMPAMQLDRPDWPDDLARIVYIDGYGNAFTGLRVTSLAQGTSLRVAETALPEYRTFGDAPAGRAFWYANSSGMAEIALNGANAAKTLGLAVGTPVNLHRNVP
ncbi:MAG: SAM-dependent chlorinase/fluorinase [Rhodospirillaceae bacterium]|nr:SAM-dependent chlorinase/fluorinase [Rhodospirillaceae bacterium]